MAQPLTWRNIGSSLRVDPLAAFDKSAQRLNNTFDGLAGGITEIADDQAEERGRLLTSKVRQQAQEQGLGVFDDNQFKNILADEGTQRNITGGRVSGFDGTALGASLRTELENPVLKNISALKSTASSSSATDADRTAYYDAVKAGSNLSNFDALSAEANQFKVGINSRAIANAQQRYQNAGSREEQQKIINEIKSLQSSTPNMSAENISGINTILGQDTNQQDRQYGIDLQDRIQAGLKDGTIDVNDVPEMLRAAQKDRISLDTDELGTLSAGTNQIVKKWQDAGVSKEFNTFKADVTDPSKWLNNAGKSIGREQFTKNSIAALQATYGLSAEQMRQISPSYGVEFDSATSFNPEQERAFKVEQDYVNEAVFSPIERSIAADNAKLKAIKPKTFREKYEENRDTLFELANNTDMQAAFVGAMSGGDASDFWRNMGQEFAGNENTDMRMLFAISALNSDIFGGKFWDDSEADMDAVSKNIKLLGANLEGEEKAYFESLADLRVREELLHGTKANFKHKFNDTAYSSMKNKGGSIAKFKTDVKKLVNGADDAYNARLAILRKQNKSDPKPKVQPTAPDVAGIPKTLGDKFSNLSTKELEDKVRAIPKGFASDPNVYTQHKDIIDYIIKKQKFTNTRLPVSTQETKNRESYNKFLNIIGSKVQNKDAFLKLRSQE